MTSMMTYSCPNAVNGELGLYGGKEREMRAKVILPRNMLGRLRATALSKDLKWLAVSERSRGAVWNLAKGERVYHVRGFRGGHFSDDGKLYADFPKFEQTERGIAQTGTGAARSVCQFRDQG